MREEVIKRIEQYEGQKGKHVDDIKKFEEKIKQAKEKQDKLQEHLNHEISELYKIDEYLEWKSE